MMNKIKEAADFIKAKLGDTPEVAMVLGSGLGVLAEEVENPIKIDYSQIPHFPVSTVSGHAGQLVFGKLFGKKALIQQGRFHFYEGWSMQEVVFPVRVMKLLGINNIFVTNAAGGVNESFNPGDLMLIKDHIMYCGESPLRGENYDELGPRFPDMSDAYPNKLRDMVKQVADDLKIDLREGVYMYMIGPTYETPAEIRMAGTIGADTIGMSTAPEVIAANHCGMNVIAISCVTNMAAGILDQPLNHQEVVETGNAVRDKFRTLVQGILTKWNLQ